MRHGGETVKKRGETGRKAHLNSQTLVGMSALGQLRAEAPEHMMGYVESLCNLESLITFTYYRSLLLLIDFFILLTLLSLRIICMTCIGGGCHAFGGC